MNDISENTTIKVNLKIPEGLEIKQKEIEVSINVERFIEEKINQKISVNNLKSGHVIKLFPNEVTVTFRLPKDKYNLLKTDFLKAEVNFTEIEAGVKFLDVHVNNLPSFIKMERLYPQKVEFLLIKE
jgi:YbbR domain-containing protein